MRIPSGVTDQYIYFVAVDVNDLKTRETGLSGFTVYRSRNGAAAAAFTTPTVNETDVTNMPGVYELLLDEDMDLAAGNDSEEVCLHITHASMAPVTRTFELYRIPTTAIGLKLKNFLKGDDLEATSHVLRRELAQAGAAGTITLDASASATDDLYSDCIVVLVSGLGAGQARRITDYVGSTKVATIEPITRSVKH